MQFATVKEALLGWYVCGQTKKKGLESFTKEEEIAKSAKEYFVLIN